MVHDTGEVVQGMGGFANVDDRFGYEKWLQGGVYRFLLRSKKKKRKITLSFTSPEKDFFFYIYDVITSPEKEKRSVTHY